MQGLEDDPLCYERVRREGFVRGVLLPVRNALGNAARVGALLEEGPGPYKKAQVRLHARHSNWRMHRFLSCLSGCSADNAATAVRRKVLHAQLEQ